MRLVLIGDGDSPHLLKWARALAQVDGLDVWAASSRGCAAGFDTWVPARQRLALVTSPLHAGGNLAVLRTLPRLGAWLDRVDADWLHAHYLTSHGTLAWLAKRVWRLRAQLVGSAWGSDVLVTPDRSVMHRRLTRRVLRACTLSTSDSAHMAERMRELGAGEVMTFPFGLNEMPAPAQGKDAWLFFANRALEPNYRPELVLRLFAQVQQRQPLARLVMANDGSRRDDLRSQAQALGFDVGPLSEGHHVEFAGLLAADTQAQWYQRAQWYLSLPQSDSIAVSVLEAMAYGCIPMLSDLPANRELIRDGDNGLIVGHDLTAPPESTLEALLKRSALVAQVNREWIAQHALFAPAVRRFVTRLRQLDAEQAR